MALAYTTIINNEARQQFKNLSQSIKPSTIYPQQNRKFIKFKPNQTQPEPHCSNSTIRIRGRAVWTHWALSVSMAFSWCPLCPRLWDKNSSYTLRWLHGEQWTSTNEWVECSGRLTGINAQPPTRKVVDSYMWVWCWMLGILVGCVKWWSGPLGSMKCMKFDRAWEFWVLCLRVYCKEWLGLFFIDNEIIGNFVW